MSFRSYCFVMLWILVAEGMLPAQSTQDLARQIAEVMARGPGGKAHQRYVHAKGIVCQGTFQASTGAASISRAAHFRGESVPITVRLSDGASDRNVADNSPDAAPRGIAIRFAIGSGTDIMAISHNGFIVGTGEDFLALQKAIAATDSSKPHPWPVELSWGAIPGLSNSSRISTGYQRASPLNRSIATTPSSSSTTRERSGRAVPDCSSDGA